MGQSYEQVQEWLTNKAIELGEDNCKYVPKILTLETKEDVHYGYSKDMEYHKLLAFKGDYVVFLEGEYPSDLINLVVYRCARTRQQRECRED